MDSPIKKRRVAEWIESIHLCAADKRIISDVRAHSANGRDRRRYPMQMQTRAKWEELYFH